MDDKLNPKKLAKHLRQPDGETGKHIGVLMNKSNKHICLNSYKLLNPSDKNHVLEIGMGNGFFVKDLFLMAQNLKYTGVDFSPTMIQEATLLNRELVNSKNAFFKEASIENLPFVDHSFDCISTTNTLYFWPQPTKDIKELFRVLKPKGKLLIGYRSKSCMDQLELTNYGFVKYEIKDVENLLKDAGFKDVSTQIVTEPEFEIDGKEIQTEGNFTMGIK